MNSTLRAFVFAIALIVTFFVGASVGQRSEGVGDLAGNLFGGDEAELSSEALETIKDNYFRDVDSDALENASVRGMVADLRKTFKDRFSHYFAPNAYARFQEATEGRFSGVGLTVTEVKQGLRVSTVFDESPAKEAGIEEQDIITEVNGKSIAGEDSTIATAEIKGKPGTEVTLTVLTPSTGESREETVTRKELRVPAVEGSMKEVDGKQVAYVRLLGFSQGAAGELRDEVERLDEQGAEGLVVDLRGNGGGLLTEAVLTSSVFVEDGVIVSTNGRKQEDQTFQAVGEAVEERPTVVLINGDTASASEIFTAALRDADLAQVVGETSFGKGVFQEVIPLDNGGALDLTVGEYLARDGESLAGTGIKPEISAADDPKTKPDEGLQQALDALGAKLSGADAGASPKQD